MPALQAKDQGRPPQQDRDPLVLVVDDDLRGRAQTEDLLCAHGFSVKCVPSSLHAIRVLERERVGVLLVEQRLQEGLDGLGLCVLVKSRWPKVRRVVMAKRPTGELVMQAKLLADARTVRRAVPPAKLVALVEEEMRAFSG